MPGDKLESDLSKFRAVNEQLSRAAKGVDKNGKVIGQPAERTRKFWGAREARTEAWQTVRTDMQELEGGNLITAEKRVLRAIVGR